MCILLRFVIKLSHIVARYAFLGQNIRRPTHSYNHRQWWWKDTDKSNDCDSDDNNNCYSSWYHHRHRHHHTYIHIHRHILYLSSKLNAAVELISSRKKLKWNKNMLNSAPVTDVNCHSTYRKGYKSKLLFFHSKGGRCSFWGLLYCDDRKSPWWASRDELQHDYIRSETVMISMNFNNYASLVIFFIISVLFCFVFELWTLYTIRVLAVFDFYYRT